MNLDFDAIQRMAVSQFWQLTVVVCVVGLLTRLLGRRWPHLAYVLWLVVLVKAVTPPVWSSPTGVFSWADARVAQSVEATMGEAKGMEYARGTEAVVGEPVTAPSGEKGDIQLFPSPPEAIPFLPGKSRMSPFSHWGSLLGLAWICGAAALGGLLVGRWSYYSVLLRHNSVETPEDVLRLVDELAKRLGVRRRVRVLVTTRPFGPAVCGIWRPTLILPEALVEAGEKGGSEEEGDGRLSPFRAGVLPSSSGRSRDERSGGEKGDIQLFPSPADVLPPSSGKSRMSPFSLRQIVAHELIHVRRGDHLVGVLQLLAQVVWWFHPLVWWTNRRICVQREHCCDEQVVAGLRCDPGTYAQSLLDTLKLRRQLRPALLPGVDAPEVTKGRLENLMDPRRVFHRRMPGVCWAILAVGVLALVPGAGITLAEKTPEAAATPSQAAEKEVAKFVESFLDAGMKGQVHEALGMMDARGDSREDVEQMPSMLAGQSVKVARVVIKQDKAMVLTSKVTADHGRTGFLQFELSRRGNLWFITDIDVETNTDEFDAFVKSADRSAAAAPNLLQNAGFEEGDGSPAGWSKGAAVDGVSYRWDRHDGFQSKASLSLRKTANRYFPIAQWHQTVDRKGAAGSLKVEARVKAKRATKATIDVIFLDAQGQWISHEWAAYIGAKDENDRPANHDWKTYSGQVSIPEGTRKITIGLQIYGPGQVWFDDVRATYVGATAGPAATSEELTGPQLIQIGWAYWMKGQYDKALPKFEQAVKLLPDNADAWNGLGWTYFNLGRRAEAEKTFQRTLKILPEASGSLNGLGQLYLLEKKYDQAEKYLLKAAPGAPAAWFGLARLYLLQGKYEEAEKWAQKIVDSNQGEAAALENARLLLKAAKEKRLDDDLRALIEPPPSAGQP